MEAAAQSSHPKKQLLPPPLLYTTTRKKRTAVPLYRKFRKHTSPFSKEEQFYMSIKLNVHKLKTRLVIDPCTRIKDTVLLSATWAFVSVLGGLTLAAVVGGKIIQKWNQTTYPLYSQTLLVQPQVTLSIIIPSFNAAHTIVPVLLSLYKGIETAGISAEIIIVDANSTDSTCSIIKRLNNSWKENGLLSCIEEGKTGLEGVQLLNYVGGEESNIGFMLHQGFLKSSGSFVLFTTQDLILPDDYPSLIHQALSSHTSSQSNIMQTRQQIEIGCFTVDTSGLPEYWMKPLLLFSNFKTYYFSIPTIENTLFMKSQTYLQAGGLGKDTVLIDEHGKESLTQRQGVNQYTNTIALFLRQIQTQGHLVVVEIPAKLYGTRWFMNPVLCFKNIKAHCETLQDLRLYHVLKSMFQDHLSYIWSLFYST